MTSKTKITATTVDATSALVPKLRFPEFQGAKGWGSGKVDDLVDTVTPPKKLPTASYASSGAFPIIDQSQSDICGWTDDNDALIREGLPLIVFGDHTCILKLISRPFAQGADGIKILKSRSKVGTPFLFQFLSHRPVVTEEYKRHYSILKEKTVFFPEFKSGEQQKIAECLSSVDELMAAQARKVDALKTHKKGLMQQLFPREGETQPRLRFPEFQKAGEWEESTVEELIVTVTPPKKLQTSDYQQEGEFPIVDQSQDYICGWTNDGEAVIDKGLPVIVFGDHTCALKFIDQPFAQGADGIKIFRPKRGIDIRFLFCALEADPVVQESYKRHFSMLKEKKLFYPDPKSGEQERIASCLSSLDDLITAETQKHEALKTHKKGLMQQLFPSPEEVEA